MIAAASSYVHGARDEPLLGLTIGQALDRAAGKWADRIALVSPSQDARWTWRQLRDHADEFAAGLLALGLRPGDRIGIWSLNRPEWALTQFAAAKAGLILVTINPASRLTELEFALNKVACVALVTATVFKSTVLCINRHHRKVAPPLLRSYLCRHGNEQSRPVWPSPQAPGNRRRAGPRAGPRKAADPRH